LRNLRKPKATRFTLLTKPLTASVGPLDPTVECS
jgi:hypothetical protein